MLQLNQHLFSNEPVTESCELLFACGCAHSNQILLHVATCIGVKQCVCSSICVGMIKLLQLGVEKRLLRLTIFLLSHYDGQTPSISWTSPGRLGAVVLFNEHLTMARGQYSTAHVIEVGITASTLATCMSCKCHNDVGFDFALTTYVLSEVCYKQKKARVANDHVSMKYPQPNAPLDNPECDNLVTKPAKCASALADKVKTLALLSSYLGPAGQLCIWCQKNRWELVNVTSWS